jgi:hypothetical protein
MSVTAVLESKSNNITLTERFLGYEFMVQSTSSEASTWSLVKTLFYSYGNQRFVSVVTTDC